MIPSYPRSQWPFPASPEVILAPSALMLLVAVVSALRMMSSSTSATFRTSPALISGSRATTESSSSVKEYGTWPTSS